MKNKRYFNTPVLFLGFNRPDLAALVLNQLRECGIQKVFIALDGPRPDHPADLINCKQMKQLAESIDWADEKKILFRERNLGCGRAVSEAITWFFSHVEKGIILEDDCFPHGDFFAFCEEMLDRYSDTPEIWSIAGTSLIPDTVKPNQSHFFSKNFNMWGWATWRRSWNSYCYDLSQKGREEWDCVISKYNKYSIEKIYWSEILSCLLEHRIDTWDFQAQFESWNINAMHVTSTLNLVENIGFREDGTHTKTASILSKRTLASNPPPYEVIPVVACENYDLMCFVKFLEDSEWIFSNQNNKRSNHQESDIIYKNDKTIKSGYIKNNINIYLKRVVSMLNNVLRSSSNHVNRQ